MIEPPRQRASPAQPAQTKRMSSALATYSTEVSSGARLSLLSSCCATRCIPAANWANSSAGTAASASLRSASARRARLQKPTRVEA
eukprot:5924355-Prymnesium_polylepis.1